MKRCSRCKWDKPLSDFSRNRNAQGDGYYSICKKCCSDKAKKSYHSDGGKKTREWNLTGKYGLTPEKFAELLAWSNEGCAICGAKVAAQKKKRLHVDHDHKTNKTRGLLCLNCNLGLGNFKDNKHLLRIAIAYLEYFEDQ